MTPRLLATPVLAILLFWGLALLIGGARILPWVTAPGVPAAAVWPLLVAAVAPALEAGLMLGLPIGASWACWRDAGPSADRSLLRQVSVALLGLGILAALLGGFGVAKLAEPGRVVRNLVVTARQVCRDGHRKAEVVVPLLGAHWDCRVDPPQLMGPLPGAAKHVSFTAANISMNDDLSRVFLDQLDLSTRSEPSRPGIHVRVARARLSGVWPGSRNGILPPSARMVFLASCATCLAWLCAFWVLRERPGMRRLGLVLCLAVGFGFGLLKWLDGHPSARMLVYGLVPLASSLPLLVALFSSRWRARRTIQTG